MDLNLCLTLLDVKLVVPKERTLQVVFSVRHNCATRAREQNRDRGWPDSDQDVT